MVSRARVDYKNSIAYSLHTVSVDVKHHVYLLRPSMHSFPHVSTGVEYICNRNPQAHSGYLTSLEHTRQYLSKSYETKQKQTNKKQNKTKQQTNKQTNKIITLTRAKYKLSVKVTQSQKTRRENSVEG